MVSRYSPLIGGAIPFAIGVFLLSSNIFLSAEVTVICPSSLFTEEVSKSMFLVTSGEIAMALFLSLDIETS
nr:hypothetical protein [Clostridium chromiireducens]